MQIGELANHFTNEFEAQNQGLIPVKEIVRMRNIIAHGYFSIDLNRIWDTAINDIPKLQSFCNEILKKNLNQNPNDDGPVSPRFRP
jgi:uncharacterized protein with HEPN domain